MMNHGPIETAEIDGIGNVKDANATWFEAEIRSCKDIKYLSIGYRN